jgi:hypothetical protein
MNVRGGRYELPVTVEIRSRTLLRSTIMLLHFPCPKAHWMGAIYQRKWW